jgi:hypothetical protein
METIELDLDQETLERAREIAALRHSTLEALIKEIIVLLIDAKGSGDPLLGMFADEPSLVDQVLDQAMTARETDALRVHGG